MNTYNIPEEFYFRLHHPRPRFKNDIENVLIYIASEIVKIGEKPVEEFNNQLNESIKMYPGNFHRSKKTIDNWRTEIDALFAFIEFKNDVLSPTYRAYELAEKQDLVKFFKLFCYHFQYPGGFVKPHANLDFINAKINFRPAHYIISMLFNAESKFGKRAGITKAEATHCIFNDLRVTRDNRNILETWSLILSNRKSKLSYDCTGDVIRYAGDILDYLVQSNILKKQLNNYYYLNKNESLAIQRFLQNDITSFNYYQEIEDSFKEIDSKTSGKNNRQLKLSVLGDLEHKWINYFNTPLGEEFFDTDILNLYINETTDEEPINLSIIIDEISEYTTGEIGTVGETLIVNHEIKRLEHGGRPDLKHLVNFIPTHLAIGYDISSRELDETFRYIEVKTTSSSKEINFNRFHLTPNEWAAAESNQDRYYIYRLMISKESIRLYIIKNPVKLYKEDKIKAIPRNGMDITFNPESSGFEEKLILE